MSRSVCMKHLNLRTGAQCALMLQTHEINCNKCQQCQSLQQSVRAHMGLCSHLRRPSISSSEVEATVSCSAAVPQSLAPCRDAPGTTAPTCMRRVVTMSMQALLRMTQRSGSPVARSEYCKSCSHHNSCSLDRHQQQAAQEVDHQQRHQNRRATPAGWAQLVPQTFTWSRTTMQLVRGHNLGGAWAHAWRRT